MTRSPQTTGEECPLPGMGVFQRTFSFSLQRTGTPVSSLVPSPRGPRHPGQLSAQQNSHRNTITAHEIKLFAHITPTFTLRAASVSDRWFAPGLYSPGPDDSDKS